MHYEDQMSVTVANVNVFDFSMNKDYQNGWKK